jgi:putative ABC transport system substrate-binding protein
VEYAEAGGLIGYGANLSATWRRAGYFVDRIVKGASAGETPMERPTKFDLVVNMKTAATIGLAIARPILVRADRVIQ